MANEWRSTMSLEEANGRPFSIAGSGNTKADAEAELGAKAALTIGTFVKATTSGPMAAPPAANGASVYSDAVLVLRNAAGKLASVHLENISDEYGIGNGLIDLTAGDITAFATAYRDGDGLGGYTPFAGEYVA